MILETKNLTLGYPEKFLCHDLNIVINSGEFWAILGQNGCGKTTLINTLSGLRFTDAHHNTSVTVDGKTLRNWSRYELASRLGTLLQEEPGEFWGDVVEYVSLGRYPHLKKLSNWKNADHEIVTQAMEKVELTSLARHPFNTLSSGERQRARIALLLAQSPHCYLLDEPLQYLDLRHQLLNMMLFKELVVQGGAVMMVLHDITWVSRYCDHVLMLFENGETLSGLTKEILTRNNLESLYQCHLDAFNVDHARHFIPKTSPGV
ncbi:MAG: ABC transporter ATP-binding protein [Nitrosomonadaceae bacterium]|nr:ABC transporter ATP-binding protein [Nitrosomonadaceae bacterium]